MYLKKIIIKNIKCFAHLELNFADSQDNVQTWTTIFGKNSLGKSTLLQAMGIVLAGPSAMRELLPVTEGWVRVGEPYGEIIAKLQESEQDGHSSPGRPKKGKLYQARYIITGNDPKKLPESLPEKYENTVILWSGDSKGKEKEFLSREMNALRLTAYAEQKKGWLACGYGPFRRLSGEGSEASRILSAERISARFVTLFREDAALTNTLDWLMRLHNTAREGNKTNERALEQVKQAFVKNLFPDSVDLYVSASEVKLSVGANNPILLQNLSDGYRSMLALCLDLLRWLIKAFPDADKPMECPGVVLIDELDAHLHPEWQRRIGLWLRQKFPKIQFITVTHSPFLAQVAEVDEKGFLLDGTTHQQMSGNIVLEQTEMGVQARPSEESTQDLRVDQILQSPLFGLETLYSAKTQEKLDKHQALYQKQQSGQPLSDKENQEYQQLGIWRENLPMLTNFEERQHEQQIDQAIYRHRDQLREII